MICCVRLQLVAQAVAVLAPQLPAPGIDLEAFTEYPSMLPVLQVRVNLNSDGVGNSGIATTVQNAVNAKPSWDCTDKASYDVEDTTSKQRLAIANIRLEGQDHPLACSGGQGIVDQPAVILILKDGRISKSDNITVTLVRPPGSTVFSAPSAAKKPTDITNSIALILTPQAAPGEALTTGLKRDVGQLSLSLTYPSLFNLDHFASVSLKSIDLFSTDERDSKSAFAVTLGATRGLTYRWYIPVSLQETIQGNQIATSLSGTTNANLAFVVPLKWSKNFFYNGYIQLPSPPEVAINGNYTHRLSQIATKANPLLAVDDFSLNPSSTLAPIYLFTSGCTWYQKQVLKFTPTASSKQYCLALQADGGLWYLPLDLTKAGSERAEGYGDISFLIPLSDIPFKSATITNLVSGSTANTQLRIKYSDTVNAANNYARTRQWTFAFEVIK